ncbi:hypothetical protein ABTA87_20745, partial [Acinetobacter baumannii]
MITDGKTFIKFKTTDGYIHVTDIQLAGKKRMKVEEFLRGYQLVPNNYICGSVSLLYFEITRIITITHTQIPRFSFSLRICG